MMADKSWLTLSVAAEEDLGTVEEVSWPTWSAAAEE